MRRSHVISLLIVGCALVLAGCLELSGQRITIRHDADGDRLLLLLCHDGIHENRDKNPKDGGADQLAEHLEVGNIMLLDWFGEIRRDDARRMAEAKGTPPALRELCHAFVTDVATHAVGHYVDPAGEIGAAQLVVISPASGFVAKANAAISEALIDASEGGGAPWLQREMPHTFELLVAEARRDRPWIALRGHAITLSFPVVRAEWARCKAQILVDLAEKWRGENGERRDDQAEAWIQLLTTESLALAELGDVVSFTLGDHSSQSTVRARLQRAYNDDLEAAVRELVPDSFDDLLAARLLGIEGEAARPNAVWQEDALSLAAPEDRVRAVLGARREEALRAPAERWLREFASAWNRAGRLPRAPSIEGDDDAWTEWYGAARAFPIAPQPSEASRGR